MSEEKKRLSVEELEALYDAAVDDLIVPWRAKRSGFDGEVLIIDEEDCMVAKEFGGSPEKAMRVASLAAAAVNAFPALLRLWKSVKPLAAVPRWYLSSLDNEHAVLAKEIVDALHALEDGET